MANGHSGKNRHIAPYPNVIAYRNGLCPLHPQTSFFRIDGVTRRKEAHIGAEKHMVTNGHSRLIKDCKIEIGKEMVAHMNVTTKITIKR